jgi:hypothetical protein
MSFTLFSFPSISNVRNSLVILKNAVEKQVFGSEGKPSGECWQTFAFVRGGFFRFNYG